MGDPGSLGLDPLGICLVLVVAGTCPVGGFTEPRGLGGRGRDRVDRLFGGLPLFHPASTVGVRPAPPNRLGDPSGEDAKGLQLGEDVRAGIADMDLHPTEEGVAEEVLDGVEPIGEVGGHVAAGADAEEVTSVDTDGECVLHEVQSAGHDASRRVGSVVQLRHDVQCDHPPPDGRGVLGAQMRQVKHSPPLGFYGHSLGGEFSVEANDTLPLG